MPQLKVAKLIKADCGHAVQNGERAYSHYTCSPGVIEADRYTWGSDPSGGWFDFRHDDDKLSLLNGQRVCCLPCARRYGYPNAQ